MSMNFYHFLIYLLTFLAGVTQVSAAGEELAQSAYLDPAEKFHLHWSFSDDDITFTLTVNTTGWFGLGFSENGGMTGADIIVAGVKDGEPYVWDMHATGFTRPVKDPKQNVELISGWEKDGRTSVTFKRRHATCDSDHDRVIGEDTMRLIYAMSPDDSDALSYHRMSRGVRSIYLRQSISPDDSDVPSDAFTVDIRSTNYEIPANKKTMYTCELIRGPKLSAKHHLIQMDPLIKPENLGMVHHMILYGCYDDMDREHFFRDDNTVHDCTQNPNMPLPYAVEVCRVPVTVWAIGGGSVYFPPEAGLPFGDKDSPRYFMLEVHYDNPQLLSGRYDDSGLRLKFTPTLRAYDAAVLQAGSIRGITVPPGAPDFRSSGLCSSDCTRQAFNEPINVYGVALHGHLATRQVLARHFRKGTELEMLSSDRHYDFNYQQYKAFKQPKQIRPGDDIMVTCHYDTSDRDTMTYGGLPTTSEMCLAYIMYYPAQNMGTCQSAPGWVLNPTNIAKKLNLPGYTAGDNIVRMLRKATANNFWTDKKVALLQEAYLENQHLKICFNKSRHALPLHSRTFDIPDACKGPEPIQTVTSATNCTDDKDAGGDSVTKSSAKIGSTGVNAGESNTGSSEDNGNSDNNDDKFG